MRVSARENRCYYVFRQTMRTRKAGNMTVEQPGKPNLFEFKQHRLYVVGPGSIHEKTSKPYEVREHTIPAMPDVLLRRLCELYGAPEASASGMTDDARRETETLDRFLDNYEVATLGDWFNKGKQWYRPIECPWGGTHENSNQGTSTCIVYTEGGGYGFDCKHKCSEKTWKEFRAELESRSDKPRFAFRDSGPAVLIGKTQTELPIIAHATLAEAFLRDNHDFLCVYDKENRPIAQWVKTRWDVSDDDTLLWRAVSDNLKELYSQYKSPDKGPDPRKRFYDAGFINGVVRCVKPYLPAVKAEIFDRDPYLLALPDCRIVDLRNSAVRDMRREDYITLRVNVRPDASCSTSRFDRFLAEITCGDAALANYLLRLCSLCLTAVAYQGLFFLWGRGRNGKGVLIRMLTAILGDDNMAWPLRPSEITVSRFGDDVMKRTFDRMEGKRLVTVNESVGGNLNVNMLKIMSGGDTLTAARMRGNQRAFKPTHKVLLPTNDRPQLPADPAFRGRVHMIPFAADFTGREDRDLDRILHTVELPGILHRLITLCPDVIENGLRPPACVLAETDQLFSELDVTKQFTDDCLDRVPDAETLGTDMEKAVRDWIRVQTVAGVIVSIGGHEDKADTILRELKQVFKYARVRSQQSGQRRGTGNGKVWVYVGTKLKTPDVATVAST
jgi:P4 family phage/plasmid primase-like protien